jgi:hypothetical protein
LREAPGCAYSVPLMRAPRAHFLLLAFAAVAAWLLAGSDVVLYLAPFLLVAGLLLSGRYLGEERILAFRRARSVVPRLRAGRWASFPEHPLASLLERTTRTLRGPPALTS